MVTTVQIKFVDAGHLYVTWRWEHALGEPRVAVADPAGLPLAELAAALPTPLPGESVRDALGRALAGRCWTGSGSRRWRKGSRGGCSRPRWRRS